MLFDEASFLMHLRNIIMGGGKNEHGEPYNDGGYVRDVPVPLAALDLRTTINYDGSEGGAAVATLGGAWITADETNARVVLVEEGTDTIGTLTIPVPRDYDEATDHFKVRVLASQRTVSTDDDVELDSNTYIKTAGSALGSDVSPAAPGGVLSTTEQWIEFDLSDNGLTRDDVVNFTLITNGANDTNAEEVVIHAVSYNYRSTIVSYDNVDDSGNDLR
jgi:hypothetical protein